MATPFTGYFDVLKVITCLLKIPPGKNEVTSFDLRLANLLLAYALSESELEKQFTNLYTVLFVLKVETYLKPYDIRNASERQININESFTFLSL